MEIPVLPIEWEHFVPRHVPPYVEVDGELELVEAHFEMCDHEHVYPLLFEGPPGVGKTLCFAAFAARKKIPIIQADLSEDVRRANLIGKFVVVGNEVYFSLGVLPAAIEVANQAGGAVLVLEEISACPPRMQKLINQLLDWRFQVYVDEIGRVFRLRKGAKLLVGATTNPAIWGGTWELNPDLRARFYVKRFDYPPADKEKEILERYGVHNSELVDRLITLATETRAALRDGQLSTALSPRDLVQVALAYTNYVHRGMDERKALSTALRVAVLGKYEEDVERRFVARRIESIFGVRVPC